MARKVRFSLGDFCRRISEEHYVSPYVGRTYTFPGNKKRTNNCTFLGFEPKTFVIHLALFLEKAEYEKFLDDEEYEYLWPDQFVVRDKERGIVYWIRRKNKTEENQRYRKQRKMASLIFNLGEKTKGNINLVDFIKVAQDIACERESAEQIEKKLKWRGVIPEDDEEDDEEDNWWAKSL